MKDLSLILQHHPLEYDEYLRLSHQLQHTQQAMAVFLHKTSALVDNYDDAVVYTKCVVLKDPHIVGVLRQLMREQTRIETKFEQLHSKDPTDDKVLHQLMDELQRFSKDTHQQFMKLHIPLFCHGTVPYKSLSSDRRRLIVFIQRNI